jgi:hypothetical protein
MDEDPRVLEAARNFIDRYGEAAVGEAELRARELADQDSPDAHAFWLKVKIAVSKLLSN